MASYVVSDTSLTAVADAIREKTGKSAQMAFPDGFVDEIGDISGGGILHVETAEFTQATDTQSVSVPLTTFQYAPVFVLVYTDVNAIPAKPSVPTVITIRLHNQDQNSSLSYTISGRKVFDRLTNGGNDNWSSIPTGTLSNTSIDMDISAKGVYFGGGLTYHVIAVESVPW